MTETMGNSKWNRRPFWRRMQSLCQERTVPFSKCLLNLLCRHPENPILKTITVLKNFLTAFRERHGQTSCICRRKCIRYVWKKDMQSVQKPWPAEVSQSLVILWKKMKVYQNLSTCRMAAALDCCWGKFWCSYCRDSDRMSSRGTKSES